MNGFSKSQAINQLGITLHVEHRPDEQVLATAYLMFAREGLLPWIWASGVISVRQFLDWAAEENGHVFAGYIQKNGEETVQLAGLGWINKLKPVGENQFIAEVGQAFFREFWGPNTAELSEMMLDWGFENLGLAAAYGTTPVLNPLAIKFVEKMGFQKIGIAPSFENYNGSPCDCLLSAVTRDAWYARPKGKE